MEDLGHICLKKRTNSSTIRIAQFTDLHQWPSDVPTFVARGRVIDLEEEGYNTNQNTQLISHVCDKTLPDLAILTGDIIDGRPCEGGDPLKFLEVFQDVIKPLQDRNIPWTYCPGNHDDDHSPWTRNDLLQIFQLEGCISNAATSFDHTFTVSFNKNQNDGASTRIWMFDSGANSEDKNIRYTTFSSEAVQGYKTLSKTKGFNPGTIGLAYFHIPLPEYEGIDPLAGKNGLFNAGLKGGVVPFPFNYQPLTSLVRILGKDRVAGCSRLNSGIFEAFVQNKNILATFVGHDHHSDFISKREGIYLCYGRCGGYTPPHNWEGSGGNLPFDHGARIVQIDPYDNNKVSTWVCTLNTEREDCFVLEY